MLAKGVSNYKEQQTGGELQVLAACLLTSQVFQSLGSFAWLRLKRGASPVILWTVNDALMKVPSQLMTWQVFKIPRCYFADSQNFKWPVSRPSGSPASLQTPSTSKRTFKFHNHKFRFIFTGSARLGPSPKNNYTCSVSNEKATRLIDSKLWSFWNTWYQPRDLLWITAPLVPHFWGHIYLSHERKAQETKRPVGGWALHSER